MTSHLFSISGRRWATGLIATAAVAATALSALPAQAATVRGAAGPTLGVTMHLPGYVGIDTATYTSTTGPATASDSVSWSMTGGQNGAVQTGVYARITEAGTPTDFFVKATANIWQGVGGYFSSVDCEIDHDGKALDQATESPYTCAGIQGTSLRAGKQNTVDITVASLPWATVRGVVAPSGSISLDQGYFETDTDNAFINDQLITAATGYQTVASGAKVRFMADERNGENPVAPAMRYTYRILDNDVPTGFWVKGFAQNERAAVFHHSDDCTIYKGDPRDGGAIAASTPYRCSMSDENVSGRGDWQVTYDITRAPITDVKPLQAGELLNQACSGTGGDCVYVPTGSRTVVETPGVLIGQPYANSTDDDADYTFKYASKRSTTNSVHVAVKVGADFFDVFKASVEFGYGWEQTNEEESRWDAGMTIRPGCVGHFELDPSYDVFTGDYLFALDGQWYRAKGVTWTVPNPKSPGTLNAITKPIAGSGMSQAQCGAPLTAVSGGRGHR